jgi:hypothetical protein
MYLPSEIPLPRGDQSGTNICIIAQEQVPLADDACSVYKSIEDVEIISETIDLNLAEGDKHLRPSPHTTFQFLICHGVALLPLLAAT